MLMTKQTNLTVKAGQVCPQDSIYEVTVWKTNPFVVPVPGVE